MNPQGTSGTNEYSASSFSWLGKGQFRTTILTLVALLAVFVIIFPFFWIVLCSFKDPEQFLSLGLKESLPNTFNINSYKLALERANLSVWMLNSLIVACATTLLSLLVSTPAAFALARIRFRKKLFVLVLLISYAIPSILIVVPLFVLLAALNLSNSYFGLILVHATLTIPFSTWVLQDFYHSIPPDLEEAAHMDGANLYQVLRYVILPLSIPGVLAAGVYSFILSWNDFLFALVIMNDAEMFTAPVGIHAYFTGRNIVESVWAQLMAATTIVSLPSVILFGFFQRFLMSGFLSGAVKG